VLGQPSFLLSALFCTLPNNGVMMNELNTIDYLFLKFRSVYIKLEDVCKEYYPHLCKEKVLEKARQHKFPFVCFRIDDSQKAPFFVRIEELASVLDEIYAQNYRGFQTSMQKAIQATI
jgi:hypothetical protein